MQPSKVTCVRKHPVGFFFHFFIIVLVGCFPSSGGFGQSDTSGFRVATFNIRYDNPSDGIYSWENRKKRVTDVMHQEKPEIIGFQEVLHNQLEYLIQSLPSYSWYGVGRNDGKELGEYAPIFFDTDRFEPIEAGTYWLSETPDIPGSRSWGAACTRIVTWIHFNDKRSNQPFLVFNTHFDHVSEQARVKAAQLLLKKADSISQGVPFIVMGDFNTTYGSETYLILASSLINTMEKFHNQPVKTTFIGFPPTLANEQVIDFIFVSSLRLMTVTGSHICSYQEGGYYPSDHLPVVCDLHVSSYNISAP